MANPAMSVNLSSEAEAIILEGFPRGATRWSFERADR
jgi:hypothetical protein